MRKCIFLEVGHCTKHKYTHSSGQDRFIALTQCSKPLVTPYWSYVLPSCRLAQLVQCLYPVPNFPDPGKRELEPRAPTETMNAAQHYTWLGGLQASLGV